MTSGKAYASVERRIGQRLRSLTFSACCISMSGRVSVHVCIPQLPGSRLRSTVPRLLDGWCWARPKPSGRMRQRG
eukprot:2037094-Alexandrium_andersonii.AAC.1